MTPPTHPFDALMEITARPPIAYPHPSDPTWPWVRRAGWDLGPPGED